MSWLPIIALGAFAFALAAFLLRLPRGSWALFGAAILFGLAGYALQGSPGRAGAPREAAPDPQGTGLAMVEVRREWFDTGQPPAFYVTLADGFSRRGQAEDAARILRGAVRQTPGDAEAWVALGNALVELAEGQVTPAALVAFERAQAAAPSHPGPRYFLGIALLRSGDGRGARRLWAQILEEAPRTMPWRAGLAERVERLDALIEQGVLR